MTRTWSITYLILVLFFSCGKRDNKIDFQRQRSVKVDTVIINCDSIFRDTGYFIRLVSFDSLLDKEHNSILTFGQKVESGLEQIYLDTVYSKVGKIEFEDYNGDDIKDILIQNISDVRSNWTYNLFLTNIKGRTLKKVKGFQVIKNPRLNRDLGIIESRVSSGTSYFEFYKLLDKDSIFKYDVIVYDSLDEESYKNYKRALEKIRGR